MPNEIVNDKMEEQRSNVRFAYFTLCVKGEDVTPRNLTKETLRIESMTKDGSLAMLVQNAVRIRAKIVSVKFEDSSKRFLVEYVANNNETGEVETIRSERTDGIHGNTAKQIWSEISKDDEVVIFKKNEPASDKSRNAANGYRVAPWVSIIKKGREK